VAVGDGVGDKVSDAVAWRQDEFQPSIDNELADYINVMAHGPT
jgi:hypothetical protein